MFELRFISNLCVEQTMIYHNLMCETPELNPEHKSKNTYYFKVFIDLNLNV